MEEPNMFYKVVLINAMARNIYKGQGYTVDEGYDFSNAHHPIERNCWDIAHANYEFLLGELKEMDYLEE